MRCMLKMNNLVNGQKTCRHKTSSDCIGKPFEEQKGYIRKRDKSLN